jgi:hypothetical protein
MAKDEIGVMGKPIVEGLLEDPVLRMEDKGIQSVVPKKGGKRGNIHLSAISIGKKCGSHVILLGQSLRGACRPRDA